MNSDPRIGKTISHYKIIDYLGGGGMGIVYKAEDIKLKRTVALKFLPAELTRDQHSKARFMHEAQAASALDHPRIGTIYEIEETEQGELFIAMAYYDGETLKKKMEGGAIPLEQAIPIINQIANGLAEAHAQGIVHRDIKPANIILTGEGFVKIVDFGLAKLGDATKITKAGTSMGTPAYMSPEQIKGTEVDHRSDIWSLGVIMYELMTGKLPFSGENEMAVLFNIVNEDPMPPSVLNPNIPVEFDHIVKKAIAKRADDRYASLSEMIGDLKTFQNKDIPSTDQMNTIVLGNQTAISQVSKGDGEKSDATTDAEPTRLTETPPRGKSVFRPRLMIPVFIIVILIILAVTRFSGLFNSEANVGKSVPVSNAEGFVNIESLPAGAAILLKGEGTGKSTPALIGPLEKGKYQVSLILEGFENWTETVAVAGQDTLTLSAQLTASKVVTATDKVQTTTEKSLKEPVRKSAKTSQSPEKTATSLAVDSEPQGAWIFLNGDSTQKQTPHIFSKMSPGKYEIRFVLDGFEEQETTVTLTPDRKEEINLKLEPQPLGKLAVSAVIIDNNSEKIGFANIFIDGKSYGQTPIAIPLKSGTYRVSAKMFTYSPKVEEHQVTIEPGKETTIKFEFVKNN